MATIGEVFSKNVAHQAGTTKVTVVSNQSDGIASYAFGTLGYVPTPSRIVPGASAVFHRDHLASTGKAEVLFSDRTFTRPDDPAGFGPQQPFNVLASNQATLALAPSGSSHADSPSWDIFLALPAPFNRTFGFTAMVIGSTIVGTTPAIGVTEQIAYATHVLSLEFIDAPR